MVKFYVKVCIVKRTGTMKKIITAILLISCIITGCSNKDEKEEIVSFKMLYNTSTEKHQEDFNKVYVYFAEDKKYIKYVRYYDNVEIQYTIKDVETLKDYLNGIKVQNDKNYTNNINEDEQIYLWNIFLKTEENKYFYTGFDDYPDYWDELWQVLLDVSDAESLADFGF